MSGSNGRQPAIEVNGLTKVYSGGVEAVKGVTFDVAHGEVFGLLGPNGAGKSTTIGMLTTTVSPTSGTARVAGCDVVTDPIGVRAASAVVFQDPVVDRPLTGRRNLSIHARLWGVARAEVEARVSEVAARFGLVDLLDRAVETYSGGQRRRLEIARSLISRPRVLFLDEPTVGLDPRIRFELLDVIGGLRDAGAMTIVLTTHYLDEAERLCDRVAIVHEGRIVALDTPRALLGQLGHEIVELRIDAPGEPLLAFLRERALVGEGAFVLGSTLTLPRRGTPSRDLFAAVDDFGAAVIAVTTRPPSLDDVYLNLTGGRLPAAA
ncbi:MAG: type transport system ATP-binding protein [Acidimicrobiaceae bacterium]